MKNLIRTSLLAASLLAPFAAFAAFAVGASSNGSWFFSFGSGNAGIAACGATICYIAQTILYLINAVLVPLVFAISFIVFLWGVASTYIISRGDETAVEHGHRLILWGLVGFAVMVSIWGLVNIVANTFGLAGYSAPPTPTSYSAGTVGY